jgi:hypothetical protein
VSPARAPDYNRRPQKLSTAPTSDFARAHFLAICILKSLLTSGSLQRPTPQEVELSEELNRSSEHTLTEFHGAQIASRPIGALLRQWHASVFHFGSCAAAPSAQNRIVRIFLRTTQKKGCENAF